MKSWVYRSVFLSILLAGGVAAADPGGAPFQFATGKILAGEGSFREALAAYEGAAQRDPDDPYIRIEHAELLLRLGDLDSAGEQALAAQNLDPDNPDVIRTLARVELALAEDDASHWPVAEELFGRLAILEPSDPQILTTLGQIQMQAGKISDAADSFQQAYRARPDSEFVQDLLIRALLRSGRHDEAREVLRSSLEKRPQHLETRAMLAELLSRAGDHEAAAATLEGMPEEELQRDPELRERLAFELYWAERYQDSARIVAELEGTRTSQQLYLLEALLLVQSGEIAEALEQLKTLSGEDANEIDVALPLARLLRQHGRASESKDVLKELVTLLEARDASDDAARVRLVWAAFEGEAGAWEEALEVLGPVLDHEDRALQGEARSLAAESLARLERFDEALSILEMSAPDPETQVRLQEVQAAVLIQAGRPEEAQELLSGWESGPSPEDWERAARIYQANGDFEKSIPLLQRVLKETPDSVYASFWLASALERTGRIDDSVSLFREIVQKNPDFHPALNYLGYLWADRGENLEEALELVEKAVELEPDNGAYVDSRGWVYYRLGRLEEARRDLERAAELVPGDPTVLEHLGDLYRELGSVDDARQAYLQALEVEGENTLDVRRKLDDLGSDQEP